MYFYKLKNIYKLNIIKLFYYYLYYVITCLVIYKFKKVQHISSVYFSILCVYTSKI